ncbi:neutral zinc metallopeptidase [Geodermatophilus obscurus]|uniref:neutral zinc metallopeptidase n=1 Tax=Geodermatophilus obscurus TaxID=1861 RepID=UPI0009F81E3E|nr:neutral zinc metallopeptidase [Geodermatophilus obscurus]
MPTDEVQRASRPRSVGRAAFSHGTSEQRQRWFRTGHETRDPAQCDTFATDDLG